jgi:hypothetical protein
LDVGGRCNERQAIEDTLEVPGLDGESLERVALALYLVAVEPVADDRKVDPGTALTDIEFGDEPRAGWLEMGA